MDKTYTVEETAQLFTEARAIVLEALKNEKDIGIIQKLALISAALEGVKLYSASSNGILGLRGLGLEVAIDLSEEILQNNGIDVRKLDFNYRKIIEGFTGAKRT